MALGGGHSIFPTDKCVYFLTMYDFSKNLILGEPLKHPFFNF